MDTTAQEIRHAARRLIRTPVFTAAAALDSGVGNWRERVALHRGTPHRAQSAALSRFGAVDCPGLRHTVAEHPIRHELDGVAALFPARRSGPHTRRRRRLRLRLDDVDRTRRAGTHHGDARDALDRVGPACVTGPRPMVYRRRRRNRRGVRRRPVAWALDAAIRWRSRHRRPIDLARRPASRSDRCDAGHIQLPRRAERALDGRAIDESRGVIPFQPHWPGSVAGRCHRRKRSCGDHGTHPGPFASCSEPACPRLDGHPSPRSRHRAHCQHTVDPAGIGRSRAAGRVRQCRESVPRAFGEQTARGGGAAGARRRPPQHRSLLLLGKRAARGGRRGAGRRARVGRCAVARRVRPHDVCRGSTKSASTAS